MLESEKIFELVEQLMDVIHSETDCPVLIYDTDGYVIRATDKTRIGTLHAGAKEMMRHRKPEYAVTREEAAENPLMREGYSCPIIIDGEIVAGFGITGRLELSRPLARTAAKMIDAWIEKIGYQEKMARSEQKYRKLFENSLNGIYQASLDGRYLTVNRAFAKIYGYPSPEEMIGDITDIADQLYVHPDDRRKLIELLLQKRYVKEFVTRAKRRDGQPIDVSITCRLMHDPDTGEPFIEGHLEDITGKRRAERKILLSEEKYFKTFNNCPVLVVLSSKATGRYVEVNETFLNTMGYNREEVIGHTSLELDTWDDPNDRSTIIDTINAHGSIHNFEVKRRTKTGKVLTMLFSADLIEVSGETCIISVSQDISDRVKIEESLRLSENNLKITLQSIGDAVITTDTNGVVTRMNPMAEQLTGWSADEAAGRPLPDVFRIVNAFTRKRESNPAQKVLSSGKIVGLANHTVLLSRDGREWQIADSGAPIRGANGHTVGVVLVFRDVTEAYAREQRVIKSEALLKNITANLPGVVYQFHATPDHQYSIRYVSGKITQQFGIDAPFKDIFSIFYAGIPEEEQAGFLDSIKMAVDQALPWKYQGRFIKAGGECIWFEGSAVPSKEEGGRMYYGVLTDITERITWERTLSASERRFKDLFNEAPVMYVITENRDGEPFVKDVNDRFLDIMGRRREEVIGSSLSRFYTPESQHELLYGGGYRRALNGQFTEEERCLVDCNGKCIHTLLHAIPEYDDNGQVQGTRAMYLDITARKQAEAEAMQLEAALARSQKMEAIGTLAGGIAHDFNNILSAVIGYSQLSLSEIESGTRLHHHLEQINTAGLRARDLVGHILTFSRNQERELMPLQVGPLIKEALKMLRATLPTTIEMIQEISSDTDDVMADPTQIQQIIMNLCTNAAQAMENSGGRLTVRLAQEEMDPEKTEKIAGLKPGPYIELRIQDTGTGIPADIIDSIFDPYFTTKERGKGTGLGLAVVHGIVTSCNGTIAVNSEPGKGSTFTVYLPAIQRTSVSIETKPTRLPRGSERILLVDDEPVLVELGRQSLEMLGYEVVTASGSEEALDLFQRAPDKIDLVISDVTMPKMTGDELAIELLQIRRDLPIILCTGFSEKLSEDNIARLGVKGFLMKPILIDKLAHLIRKVL